MVFQMVYNCAGKFVRPFVIHDGQIEKDNMAMYGKDMYFMQTSTGEVNSTFLNVIIQLLPK